MQSPVRDVTALSRALAELVGDTVIITDADGRIEFWNAPPGQPWGWRAEDAVGQPLTFIAPPDRYEEWVGLRRRAAAGEFIRHFETLRRRRDGTTDRVRVGMTALATPAGAIDGYLVIVRDAPAPELGDHSALRLAAIVESSDDAIVSKDLNGIVKTWNRAAERMFGWTEAEMIGRSIRTIVPADRQSEEEEVLRRMRAGDRLDHFQTIRQRKDGSLVDISLTVSPIRGADGTVIGASKIARDISQLKQHEAERQRLLAESQENAAVAERLSRLKDEFLASLSHELRTPLNAILGYSRMLRTGSVSPENRGRALDTIERNATSLAQLVDDVLDVSRIVAGKMRLSMQDVDASVAFHDAIDAVRPAAAAKGIRFETHLPEGARLSADPARLQQILWNLLSNAVKFTGRGGVIETRIEHDDTHVVLVVRDSGVGIAPELLPFIFERFRQGEGGRERGGLGLGLSIARQLAELHGGTIHASSEGPGHGATFQVVLPMVVPAP